MAKSYEHALLNKDLVEGALTFDLIIYRNSASRISWETLIEQIEYAKEIFGRASVQLNVLGLHDVIVKETLLVISESEFEGDINEFDGTHDFYDRIDKQKAVLSRNTADLFTAISRINLGLHDHRTISIVVIDEAKTSWFEKNGDTWTKKIVETSALSFPPYKYSNRLPLPFRGFIALQELKSEEKYKKTLAHEIGHKLINVSHESMEDCPQAVAHSTKGLMVYGTGTEIPGGVEGRWHQERLQLSPFLYVKEGSRRRYNKDFEQSGKYSDSIYGSFVVRPSCQ